MRIHKNVYLIAALIGTFIPWFFFASFIGQNGLDIPLFVQNLFVNNPGSGAMADLLISAVVFWVWSYADAQQHGVRGWWWAIPTTLAVGLSLALPLYLYLRTDQMETA